MADSTDTTDDSPQADEDGTDQVDPLAESEPDTDESGFSLSLPPISLPPLFPADFRILWPTHGEKLHGRVTRRAVAAALLAFDAVDALLAVSTDSAILAGVRVVGGALLAAMTFGTLGVAYVWEAAAVLVGVGELTAVPTLAVLLAVRLLQETR